MTRLTPEREKWIRDNLNDIMLDKRGLSELLAEIDALRENNSRLTDFYHKIRGTDKDHQVNFEKAIFDLEIRSIELNQKLDIAVKALELGLDFYHLNTIEWVVKYCPGMTTKELGNTYREALAKIRGEK